MSVFASTTFLGDRPTDVADALRLLKDIEIDGVELGSTHNWQADMAQEVSRHWNRALLTHNYFPPAAENLVLNIASGNRDIRDASIAHMKFCLAFAGDIGAAIYTVHPGFLSDPTERAADRENRSFDFGFGKDKTPYGDAFGLMIDALKVLAEHADKAGVTLAIETEGSLTSTGISMMESPEEYRHLFDAIPQGVSVNVNLAHSSLAAKRHGFDIVDFLRGLRGRIVAAEISHNDAFHDQHRPLEHGAEVLSLIRELPDVPLILEFRLASAEDVADSARILRRTMEAPDLAQAQ